LITINPSVFHGPTGENVLFGPTDGHAGFVHLGAGPAASAVIRLISSRRATVARLAISDSRYRSMSAP
jgi:hypothetical protein